MTYLPTILMNVINQATNYLGLEGKTDLVITVNITCMMVLTSVYLSVSSTLPSTLRIKPVEIWLLVNLAFPFLVIIFNIVLEVSWRSESCTYTYKSYKQCLLDVNLVPGAWCLISSAGLLSNIFLLR